MCLTSLNLNPELHPDCTRVDSMSLRHSYPSRVDAAGADYFEVYRFGVCPCLEDETQCRITKSFLIGTPNRLFSVRHSVNLNL